MTYYFYDWPLKDNICLPVAYISFSSLIYGNECEMEKGAPQY